MINVISHDGVVVRHTNTFMRALLLTVAKKLNIPVDTFEASLSEGHNIRYHSNSDTYSIIMSFENEYIEAVVTADAVFIELIKGIPDARMPKPNEYASIW